VAYAYAPKLAATITSLEYQIELETNWLGLRDDPLTAGEHVDILAVGDSFTVDFGVEAEDSWPSRLQSYLAAHTTADRSARVLNAGVSGYSLGQIRLATGELLYREPALVVLGLYPSRYWRLKSPIPTSRGTLCSVTGCPTLRSLPRVSCTWASTTPRSRTSTAGSWRTSTRSPRP
jgi:hypothetical protein